VKIRLSSRRLAETVARNVASRTNACGGELWLGVNPIYMNIKGSPRAVKLRLSSRRFAETVAWKVASRTRACGGEYGGGRDTGGLGLTSARAGADALHLVRVDPLVDPS